MLVGQLIVKIDYLELPDVIVQEEIIDISHHRPNVSLELSQTVMV